jgi:hypothetical protein
LVVLALSVACLGWLAGTAFLFDVPARMVDLLRFAVPGIVLAAIAWGLHGSPIVRKRVVTRIGANLMLISALAFAVQGIVAFDPADPHSFASRLRVAAWSVSWLAFIPGAPMLAMAFGRRFAAWSIPASAIMCVPGLMDAFPAMAMHAGLVGLAFYPTWFAWWCFAASRLPAFSRGAT